METFSSARVLPTEALGVREPASLEQSLVRCEDWAPLGLPSLTVCPARLSGFKSQLCH